MSVFLLEVLLLSCAGKFRRLHAIFNTVFLQLAVPVLLTAETVPVVLGQQKVQYHPSRCLYTFTVGQDHHAFLHLRIAGGNQFFRSAKLYHTQPAGADIIDTLEITECRDLNSLPAGRLKDRAALGGLYISSIYCYLHLLPPICLPHRQAFRIQIHRTAGICRTPAESPHRSSDIPHARNHASLSKPDAPGY